MVFLRKIFIPAIIYVLLFFVPYISFAELYSWEDNRGAIHITDNYWKIPPAYRRDANRLDASPLNVPSGSRRPSSGSRRGKVLLKPVQGGSSPEAGQTNEGGDSKQGGGTVSDGQGSQNTPSLLPGEASKDLTTVKDAAFIGKLQEFNNMTKPAISACMVDIMKVNLEKCLCETFSSSRMIKASQLLSKAYKDLLRKRPELKGKDLQISGVSSNMFMPLDPASIKSMINPGFLRSMFNCK